MKIVSCFIITLMMLGYSYAAYAQNEEIEITTYYPAPYGEYDSLSVGSGYAAPVTDGNLIVEGNVGIGTRDPDVTLHVVGNIKMVDGNQGDGKVLTSDVDGTATWQDPAGAGFPAPNFNSGWRSFSNNTSDTISFPAGTFSATATADDLFVDIQVKTGVYATWVDAGISNFLTTRMYSNGWGLNYSALSTSSIVINMGTDAYSSITHYRVRVWEVR